MTQPYPAYRETGFEGLEQVPSEWATPELKRFATLTYGDSLAAEIREDDGVVPVYGSNGPVGTHSVPNGLGPVILVGRKGSYGALNWCDTACFAIDTVYYIDGRHADCHLRWLFWALNTARFEGSSQDTGVPGLSRSVAYLTRLPLPPLSEQTAIAAFLDQETAKIDGLVAEQRRLIDLLREMRQAVISHAVTRGLNPAAPLKPSGIDWLGDVPEGWEVMPVKFQIQTIEQGWSPQCDGFPAVGEEWGVLKVGCVNGGEFRATENKALPADLVPLPDLALKRGDILISRANTRELVGGAAIVPVDFPTLMICDKLYRLRIRPNVIVPEYLVLGLSSAHARNEIELEASGASASMVNIPQGTVLNMKLPVPPLDVQESIVAFVSSAKRTFDTLTATAFSAIALLQERRAALISAAVTGKIDVRGGQVLQQEPV